MENKDVWKNNAKSIALYWSVASDPMRLLIDWDEVSQGRRANLKGWQECYLTDIRMRGANHGK